MAVTLPITLQSAVYMYSLSLKLSCMLVVNYYLLGLAVVVNIVVVNIVPFFCNVILLLERAEDSHSVFGN